MAGPSPPPQEEEEQDDEAPEQAEPEPEDDGSRDVYPFYDVAAGGGATADVRAGWADGETGEPVELVVNYTGSAASPATEAAASAAWEWYIDAVSALARAQDQEQ
jgi:hypothetical protein